MKPISWKTFMEKIYEWSPSTVKNAVYALQEFGTPQEMMEVLGEFEEEQTAVLFIKRAVQNGVTFTTKQAMEMIYEVPDEAVWMVIEATNGVFSENDLDELELCLPEEQFRSLVSRQSSAGQRFHVQKLLELERYISAEEMQKQSVMQGRTVSELLELADYAPNYNLSAALEQMLNEGRKFLPAEVVKCLQYKMSDSLLQRLVLSVSEPYSEEQVNALETVCGTELMRKVMRLPRQGQYWYDWEKAAREEELRYQAECMAVKREQKKQQKKEASELIFALIGLHALFHHAFGRGKKKTDSFQEGYQDYYENNGYNHKRYSKDSRYADGVNSARWEWGKWDK